MKTTTSHTKEPKTKVIFRKWKTNGDIIAFFPQIPGTRHGYDCLSYERVGQHGTASLALTSDGSTTLATPDEYAALHKELTAIGYDITVGKRRTRQDDALRIAASRNN